MELTELLTGWRQGLRRDAVTWGVAPARAEAVFVAAFAGAVVVIASRAYQPLFAFLTEEDRLLEWAQFFGFAASAGLAAVLAARLWGADRRGLAALYGLAAVALLFIAGEEISWGQRILGWGTPADLEELNKQGETNIHNIERVLTLFNLGMLAVGFYGSVIATWLRLGRKPDLGSWDLYVPPLFLTSWFFVLFVYRGLRFTLLSASRYTFTKAGEYAEFSLAFALTVWLALNLRRWERSAPPSSAASDVEPA